MHGKASPRLPSAPLMSVAPESDGFSQLNPTRSVFRKSTNKTMTSSENYKIEQKRLILCKNQAKYDTHLITVIRSQVAVLVSNVYNN